MNIQIINPLVDDRWHDLAARHPRASVFHEKGWLEALSRTYGYKPYVLTSARDGEPLNNGIVFCRISSWITGTRLVSLPFADHWEPLVDNACEFNELMAFLRSARDQQACRYVEIRPLTVIHDIGRGWQQSSSYWYHELDMRPSLDRIFRGLHKNSFRRKIRRAQIEHLSYEVGCSEALIDEFYRLLLITRRRHRLLPQPRAWFKNLMECMADKAQIRVARKDGVPIAAMLTLRHGRCVVFKYGCSDARFHRLGGTPFLFWRLIEEGKTTGTEKIDFGRTDLDNEGLIAFKDRLGAKRKLLTYYRHAATKRGEATRTRELPDIGGLISTLPDPFLTRASSLLYRHLG
ncbi:MAG TPA: GNAT family N-acetyltransferase [Candidatus Acidoferrales bacterium]|nr:GNAT family N-acetyltransferase [Candidatus Acidoferrales bacterium]